MPQEKRRSERKASSAAHPQWSALGRAIKLLRTEQGMDRGGLAEASGLSYPYLSEIENGRKQPSTSALTAIAEALDMSPSELLAATEWSLGPKPEALDVMPARMEMGAGPPPRSWFRESDASMPVASAAPLGAEDELHALIGRLSPADVELLLQIAKRLV